MKWVYTLLWYAALFVGLRQVYRLALAARRVTDPLERARLAASQLLACGWMLWAYAVLGDARRELGLAWGRVTVMTLLAIIGTSLMWMLVMVGPTWLPRRLLSGNPGPSRCGMAAFIARAIAVFAGLVILFSPMGSMFATSGSEFFGGVLSVVIPMAVVVVIALSAAKWASLAGR